MLRLTTVDGDRFRQRDWRDDDWKHCSRQLVVKLQMHHNCWFWDMARITCSANRRLLHDAKTALNRAPSEYKHSLTFRIRVMLSQRRYLCTDCKSAQYCTTKGHPLPFPQVTSGFT